MKQVDEKFFDKNNESNSENSVESILNQNEKILLRLKPVKNVYFLDSFSKGFLFVLFWLCFDAFAITMLCIEGELFQPGMVAFFIVFFAFHLLPVWLFIAQIVKHFAGYKNLEYVFTDKRIIIRNGVIAINMTSIFYSDITDVKVRVGILEKIFKVGDIYITSNTAHYVLDDLKDAYFYMNKIQTISHDIKTDISFPNALRPDNNPGYNVEYKKDTNLNGRD